MRQLSDATAIDNRRGVNFANDCAPNRGEERRDLEAKSRDGEKHFGLIGLVVADYRLTRPTNFSASA